MLSYIYNNYAISIDLINAMCTLNVRYFPFDIQECSDTTMRFQNKTLDTYVKIIEKILSVGSFCNLITFFFYFIFVVSQRKTQLCFCLIISMSMRTCLANCLIPSKVHSVRHLAIIWLLPYTPNGQETVNFIDEG